MVTLFTTEEEFIVVASCACQAIWLRKILDRLNHAQEWKTVFFCNNNTTIKLYKNPVLHERSKYINIRFHFLRDLVRDEVIELVYCSTQDQLANLITKPLNISSEFKNSENSELRVWSTGKLDLPRVLFMTKRARNLLVSNISKNTKFNFV